MKRHLALGLADAMLFGSATAASAAKRCAKAIGSSGAWLGVLCKAVVKQHLLAWHPASRHAIAATILAHSEFEKVWRTDARPALRVYFPLNQQMSPRPLGLEHCALPDLPSVGSIAKWLALEPAQLDWFADVQGRNPDAPDARLQHYHCHWVPKRSGGHRLLEVPKVRLKQIQHRILRELLEYVPPHDAAHGFRARHSCKTNAEPHVGQAIVIRMDLQDFFISIGHARVEAVFRVLGYPERAAQTFAGLCTTSVPARLLQVRDATKYEFELPRPDWLLRKRLLSHHLPQGAPTSPVLANLCAFNLDLRLAALAQAMGGRYTRYADDLIFSGGNDLARSTPRFVETVARVVQEEGYALNFRKTRIMRASTRQQVTGIVVNKTLNLPRSSRDELKATLHNCVRFGPSSQNRAGVADFRAHLAGRVAHLAGINPALGHKFKALFDRVIW
jgi:RNA-directed DNA polymerase